MKLITGLYEAPITVALEAGLARLTQLQPMREPITAETAPHVLGRVIHDAAVRALRNVPAQDRLALQIALANRVLAVLAESAPESGLSGEDAVAQAAELLLSLRNIEDVRLGVAEIVRPNLPLRHSDLLVNGPRDLRIGREIPLELASADRVDLLISFVK